MTLRKLSINIELPTDSTGKRAKEEHARALSAILQLLEATGWGAFSVDLFATDGRKIGHASLSSGGTTTKKEIPSGNSESIAA